MYVDDAFVILDHAPDTVPPTTTIPPTTEPSVTTIPPTTVPPPPGSVSFGAEQTVEEVVDQWPSNLPISLAAMCDCFGPSDRNASDFMAQFSFDSPSTSGVRRCTVSGTSVSVGAKTEYLSGYSQDFTPRSIAWLGSNRFLVFYAVGTLGKCRLGTVSGTAVSFGPEQEFFDGSGWISVVALSSGTAVVCVLDNEAVDKGKAWIATVSGSDVTFGPESVFDSTVYIGNYPSYVIISCDALGSSSFAVAYITKVDTVWTVSAKVGQVSGAAISFGSSATLSNVQSWSVSVAALDSSRFVVCYGDQNYEGKARVCSVSGTNITAGPEASFPSTGGPICISAVRLSSSKIAVCCLDWDYWPYRGDACIGTISGVNATFGSKFSFVDQVEDSIGAYDTPSLSVTALSPSSFAVCYFKGTDEAPWIYGLYAKIGTVY